MDDGAEDMRAERPTRDSGLQRRAPERDREGFEHAFEALTGKIAKDPWLEQTVAGRYRVLSLIAKGGMGRVYAAEHTELGTRVAIKLLPSEGVTPSHVERFRREARAAGRLRSPHVPEIHDFGQLPDGSFFFVMEMLVGEDLGRLLRREGTLEPARALRLLRQVANALDAAHAQGFVHRDLKPENVFVVVDIVYEDFVKVLDFGIAKSLIQKTHSLTEAGSVLGTPGFLPPEQVLANGTEEVTPASDVYSLAAMALEMMTGALPIDDDNIAIMLRKLVSEPPRLPSALGLDVPGLDAVFEKALAKRPADRHQSAGELLDDLEAVLAGAPTPERPALPAARPHVDIVASEAPTLDAPLSTLAPPPVAPAPPRGWLPWLLLAVGLALGLGLGLWLG